MKKRIFVKEIKPLIYFLLITIGIAALSERAQGQVITANDSFEGTPIHNEPPPYWSNCNDGVSTVDTQPGIAHNYMPAYEGEAYISMVTREMNPPGTVETVWAELLQPFEKDMCYTLQVDMSLSHDLYGTLEWQDYYFDNPCIMEIYGFNGECYPPLDSELLWKSAVLDNYSWQEFEPSIRPVKNTFRNIAFKVNFSSPGNFKNGVVFVDNLRMRNTTELLKYQNGILSVPEGSTQISWYLNGQEIGGSIPPGWLFLRAVFIKRSFIM